MVLQRRGELGAEEDEADKPREMGTCSVGGDNTAGEGWLIWDGEECRLCEEADG